MKRIIILLSTLLFTATAFSQNADQLLQERIIEIRENLKGVENILIDIPGEDYRFGKTEVTQKLYIAVMGENPSFFRKNNPYLQELIEDEWYTKEYGETINKEWNENFPVENVSWFDAIYFCNLLSYAEGKQPVYECDELTNPFEWEYEIHQGELLRAYEIRMNDKANGYRLPKSYEWYFAVKGGEAYTYACSNNIDEVAWYEENSGNRTHPVAQKKCNGYGLYDMIGNVQEWVWDKEHSLRWTLGGCFLESADCLTIIPSKVKRDLGDAGRVRFIGFRLCTNKE